MVKEFDVLVVGGGIAGVTAAIYLKRSGKSVAIIERASVGGQIITTHSVENYPLVKSASGYEIASLLQAQIDSLQIELIYDNIISFDLQSDKKVLNSAISSYRSNFVILAMGSSPKPLGLLNEAELVGSGISYCTTCDGAFFRGRDVLVSGVGGHAVSSAKYLAPIANKVYVVASGKLKGFDDAQNIEVFDSFNVTKLNGNPLKSVIIENSEGIKKELNVEGLFVASGNVPATSLLKGVVELDERGYIITNDDMQTNVYGVFAAGDIRKKNLRQLVTAASDGAIAATSILKAKSKK